MDEELLELLKQAVMDNVIEIACPQCGQTIRCEPDADTSYCYGCDEVVENGNPLIANGLI